MAGEGIINILSENIKKLLSGRIISYVPYEEYAYISKGSKSETKISYDLFSFLNENDCIICEQNNYEENNHYTEKYAFVGIKEFTEITFNIHSDEELNKINNSIVSTIRRLKINPLL
jgi:hypothetical protein